MGFCFYHLLFFDFLCNFQNFMIYDFISFILGVFKDVLVNLESYYDFVTIRICLGLSLLGK